MLRRNILFTFLILFYTVKGIAQVNLQSGSATYNISMFNWQDNKSRLSLNVGLNYNSGMGLKVDEIPGSVGAGWNLIAGGEISRIQIGQPDDQKPKDGPSYDLTKYPAGYLYNNRAGYNECPEGLTKYPLYGSQNQLYKQHNSVDADRELDYFSFQFNGRGGLFVLNKYFNNCYIIGDSKLKIKYVKNEAYADANHLRTTITEFQIIDENNVLYTFNKLGLTKVLVVKPCDVNGNRLNQIPNYGSGQIYYESSYENNESYIVSTWHLTEIKDLALNRTITFNYSNNIYSNVNNSSNSLGYDLSFIKKYIAFPPKPSGYFKVTFRKSVTITPQLNEIILPDNYKVAFDYDSRNDIPGWLYLKKARLLLNNSIQNAFSFKMGYFHKNQIQTYGDAYTDRLCLLELQQSGPLSIATYPPYKFEYYMGNNDTEDFVPPLFCCTKDYCGYYNGYNSHIQSNIHFPILSPSTPIQQQTFNSLYNFCYLKELSTSPSYPYYNPQTSGINTSTINAGYAKNGLLKNIVLPTKGMINYEYEQNVGKLIQLSNIDQNLGGVHVSKVNTFSDYTAVIPTSTIKYKYILSNNQSSFWGAETPVNYNYSSVRYEPEKKEFTLGSWGFDAHCYYEYPYPGIQEKEASVNIDGISDFLKALVFYSNFVSLGTFIADLAIIIIGGTGGAGTPAAIVAIAVAVIMTEISVVISCTSNDDKTLDNSVYTNYNMNAINSFPQQYERVEVEQSDQNNNSDNGKTIYEFTSPNTVMTGVNFELNDIYGGNSNSYSNKQRSYYWLYGQPLKTLTYNKSGEPVKMIEYFYQQSNSLLIFANSCNCLVKRLESKSYRGENSGWWMNFSDVAAHHFSNSISGVIEVTPYSYNSGRIELIKTIERNYKQNIGADVNLYSPTNHIGTVTEYQYNQNNFQISSVTTKQIGVNDNYYIKEIYYPGDYNTNNNVLNTLKTNYFNTPIASYTAIVKNGGTQKQYLSASVTEFDFVNSDIKPVASYIGRPLRPVNFNFDATNYKNFPDLIKVQDIFYDNKNNLITSKDEGNHIVSNIYGYDDKFVIASVINADLMTDKPAYTSFEYSGDYGGWNVYGAGNSSTTKAVTGYKYYSLYGPSTNMRITNNINNTKKYIISFWAKRGFVEINGQIINTPKTNITIEGYSYFEYEVPSNTSTVTINAALAYQSSGVDIDELRIYPVNARMRTVTYDPLFGKTSECDENNRITYYEYDKLGRLQIIKDEKGNILKTYEYNYKN